MKKLIAIAGGIFICLIILAGVNKYNPYLRTDLFRSFAKGNWYILSEKDTIYTMGYHGVRKYIASDPGNPELLIENDDFCTDRIIGRGGCEKDDYLYVTARSFLPVKVKENRRSGELLVLKKSDLSIVTQLKSDMKLVEARVKGDLLVVSGIPGFCIYNISSPGNIKEVFSWRRPGKEYQGFDFIEKDENIFVAFSNFGDGLEIWDITRPETASIVCSIPIEKQMWGGKELPAGQSMDLVANYPYIYATLGPLSETFKTENDRRGLLVYDISDLNNIKKTAVFIPRPDWYHRKTGDRQPTYITQYKDRLYLNFAEKGVAVFDIKDAANPGYRGTLDVSGKGALIQPIHATESGKLFAGSYYWTDVYELEINQN